MPKGTITKLSRNKNALRTNGMVGEFNTPPEVGRSFSIFGESLTEGGLLRAICTSRVQSVVEEKNGWKIQTENSSYRITKGESTDG